MSWHSPINSHAVRQGWFMFVIFSTRRGPDGRRREKERIGYGYRVRVEG